MATFSAVITQSGADVPYGPFSVDKTVLYNKVITNIGKAYNPLTGVFSAPSSGLYYFTFYYNAPGAVKTKLSLMKNSNPVASASGQESVPSTANNGGNAMFLQLNQDDQVSVLMSAGGTVRASDGLTSFSGHRLG